MHDTEQAGDGSMFLAFLSYATEFRDGKIFRGNQPPPWCERGWWGQWQWRACYAGGTSFHQRLLVRVDDV